MGGEEAGERHRAPDEAERGGEGGLGRIRVSAGGACLREGSEGGGGRRGLRGHSRAGARARAGEGTRGRFYY